MHRYLSCPCYVHIVDYSDGAEGLTEGVVSSGDRGEEKVRFKICERHGLPRVVAGSRGGRLVGS